MAVEVTISYLDVNGDGATNKYASTDAASAAASIAKFKALTNAKIIEASYSTPIDISGLTGNTAAAANLETVKAKVAITMSGPKPTGATRRPSVTLQIPAPLGSLVNGATGDTSNALITTLLSSVLSSRGETLDTVERVAYVR